MTTYRYNGDGQRVTLTTGCTTTAYVGNYFEWTGSAATMTSYYYAGGTRVAMRAGTPLTGTVNYLLGDHLGSSSVSYRVGDGQTVTQRYYPWGSVRATTGGVLPTDYTFTGQKLDASAGLMYYGARYYDSALGRFLQADTLVPQPGNPQALNRYSYALNNPLRYTDPTGMFSEDEIMKYLNVDTWEEVLAMFAEGGQFAGRWGVLGLLRAANLGDKLDAYDGCFSVTCAKEEWGYKHAKKASGILRERDGQLLLEGSETWNFATLATSADLYHLDSANVWVGYKVYWDHVRYDWLRVERNIDWVGVGFDLGGVAADIVTFGAAGRVINAVQVANSARKVGQALDVSGAAYNLGAGAVEWYQEGRISGETARSIGYSAAGFIPGLGTLSDATSAIDGIFYWGP